MKAKPGRGWIRFLKREILIFFVTLLVGGGFILAGVICLGFMQGHAETAQDISQIGVHIMTGGYLLIAALRILVRLIRA